MRRATNIIMPVIVLMGILALLLISGSGCGGKSAPATTVYYPIGQPVETSRQILTVVSAERTNQYFRAGFGVIISLYVNAPPGTEFIIVEITVTNTGHGALEISRDDFSLKDSAGREYSNTKYEGLYPYPTEKLAPGQTASGKIVFIVPPIATGLELSCTLLGNPTVLGIWQLSL